ncbi:sigma-70 family RNA polymerase sigma factor [Streptomyces griseoincarnatus]
MLQAVTRKRAQTEEEARVAITARLNDRRAYWYAVIRRRLPERYADDVYGQASLRIAEWLEKYDPRDIDDVDGFIARTCINCAIDELRRLMREAAALVKVDVTPEAITDDQVAASHGYLLVREVMADHLTERQHLVYVLRHVKELNGREIADTLGISHSLARKELSAAQKALDKEEVKERLRKILHAER